MISQDIINCINKASEYKGVSRIGIFGSFARAEVSEDNDELTENSDFDILYHYNYIDNENNGISDMFTFIETLETDLSKFLGGRKIDFVSYHAIADSDNIELKQSIMNDVIWIYEQTQT